MIMKLSGFNLIALEPMIVVVFLDPYRTRLVDISFIEHKNDVLQTPANDAKRLDIHVK